MTPTPKIKFITNKDLLSEIARSKNTYCHFVADEYVAYDTIVPDVAAITPSVIDTARLQRAEALMAIERARQKANGVRNYAITVPVVDPSTIPISGLTFRVMSSTHIPVDPTGRKRRSHHATAGGGGVAHMKVNFPPFTHHAYVDGVLTEVGRSHWAGSLSNGEFDGQCGRMTPRLASMFILLVNRFSRKINFANYSYNEEMRGAALVQLSQVGLQFDESKSSNPFAFFTTVMTNVFRRILILEKRNQVMRDELLMAMGASPSHTKQGEFDTAPPHE